jgi:cobalt-precorrin 5A hydrolase / precorrin-3B C17-methyltransferase
MKKPAVIILSDTPADLALRIAEQIGGAVHGLRKRVSKADIFFDETGPCLRNLFENGTPLIAIMSSGALIRLLAPALSDKHSEPPVLAVAEDGSSVVPLLGGHHGANDLARKIADVLGGHAAVTTAGDLRFGIALDAPPEGFKLVNPENAKDVMARLLAGERAVLKGEADWLSGSGLPLSLDGAVELIVSDRARQSSFQSLHYAPATLAMGIGCERGAESLEVISLAEAALTENGLEPKALAGIFSIDLKADEASLHAAAAHLGVPLRLFDAETLEAETPRLANPSDTVFAEVGCHGVSEGAALAAAGPEGTLVVPKLKSRRATVAIARATQLIKALEKGRGRGRLFIVGIGPGKDAWRSPEASAFVEAATDLVGYSLYLDLLGTLANGKVRHDFDLGAEEARVRHALELAGQGRDVALICSGDAGIYAMATLVFELIDRGGLSDAAKRVDVAVTPGISALQAAAARIGAPLGHDFCTISLSDLLTPIEDIRRRVRAAAEGDFVIAFYNPVSKKRRTQLAEARDVLLRHRTEDTPVILATNLGREGELVQVVPLRGLNVDDVDMLTVVIVGSSQSRVMKTGDGKTWVYTPRGYAAKAGAGIAPSNKEAAE